VQQQVEVLVVQAYNKIYQPRVSQVSQLVEVQQPVLPVQQLVEVLVEKAYNKL
jgi:hypothetical protein